MRAEPALESLSEGSGAIRVTMHGLYTAFKLIVVGGTYLQHELTPAFVTVFSDSS